MPRTRRIELTRCAVQVLFCPVGKPIRLSVAAMSWSDQRVAIPRMTARAADGQEAKAGIAEWIGFYNNRRPHQALGDRTPMAVWRDGVTGALGERGVDMTLRFDNAGALPTYPQPRQQQHAA